MLPTDFALTEVLRVRECAVRAVPAARFNAYLSFEKYAHRYKLLLTIPDRFYSNHSIITLVRNSLFPNPKHGSSIRG